MTDVCNLVVLINESCIISTQKRTDNKYKQAIDIAININYRGYST